MTTIATPRGTCQLPFLPGYAAETDLFESPLEEMFVSLRISWNMEKCRKAIHGHKDTASLEAWRLVLVEVKILSVCLFPSCYYSHNQWQQLHCFKVKHLGSSDSSWIYVVLYISWCTLLEVCLLEVELTSYDFSSSCAFHCWILGKLLTWAPKAFQGVKKRSAFPIIFRFFWICLNAFPLIILVHYLHIKRFCKHFSIHVSRSFHYLLTRVNVSGFLSGYHAVFVHIFQNLWIFTGFFHWRLLNILIIFPTCPPILV